MNYKNLFIVDDWSARGKATAMELFVMLQWSALFYPVFYFFDIEHADHLSVAFSAIALCYSYIEKTPYQEARSGLENEEMTIKRCHRHTHSFYRVLTTSAILHIACAILF